MPACDDAHFVPPAPVLVARLQSPQTGASVSDVLLLIDSGADVTLLPREKTLSAGIESTRGVCAFMAEAEPMAGDEYARVGTTSRPFAHASRRASSTSDTTIRFDFGISADCGFGHERFEHRRIVLEDFLPKGLHVRVDC